MTSRVDFFLSGFEQKNVVIQRDRFGYGLTVSGDNPVYVLSVREGGAAHRAGINTNDQIIRVDFPRSSRSSVRSFLFQVNGTRVTHLTHIDVVNLIKCKWKAVRSNVSEDEKQLLMKEERERKDKR